MPGTVGSLWGPVWVWGLQQAGLPVAAYVAICVAIVLLGLPVCARAAKLMAKHDPGAIVYDEIAAFPIVFAVVPVGWITGAVGFLWFRLFDILKPWPIRRFEKLPGAVGVMADDLAAAVYAAAALWGTVSLVELLK